MLTTLIWNIDAEVLLIIPSAEYLIEIEINVEDIQLLKLLRNLSKTILPFKQRNINITEMNITTVCSLNGTEYQCRCEDQYFWPCEKCTLYGSCDDVNNVTCGCINTLPNDGHFCQPNNELTTEYLIEFEIDAVDRTVLKQIRNLLKTLSSPVMHSNINMSEMTITTVCSLNGTEYQCRCEDQYFWPCEKCTLYGSCDDVTGSSCGCINTLPNDEHFCQPINELSLCSLNGTEYQCRCEDQYFWPCEKCTLYGSCDDITNVSCRCINTLPNNGHFCQPIIELNIDYLFEIEIAVLDMTLLNELRILSATLSSIVKQNSINITELNITTVCSLNGTEYQCRCEDQYFWPCEKCTLYGSCDDVNNVSCGCINDLPNDGHFCQPISDLTTEYLFEIQIDAVDMTVLILLKNLLATLSKPFIHGNVIMTEMNITTVCSLNGNKYQCRCEDQYFWPCEKCTLYGSCDHVTESLCGCINDLPNEEHFCQPIIELSMCSLNGTEYQCRCEDQYFWPCEKCTLYGSCDDVNNVTCGYINTLPNDGHFFCQPNNELTTEYLIEFEIDAVDRTILKQIRNVLTTLSSPAMHSNINMSEMTITTVCSLNGTEYQCKCEAQYLWPCEKCTLYGSCDHVNGPSCGCINTLPNDGHFCQPISDLTAEYLYEIKIDAVDMTVLKLLKNLSATLSSPLIHGNVIMTEMNINTVCSLNGNKYQCRCEDQYFWPCEKCTLYGSCDHVNGYSCGCINDLPIDEHFCQPINELSNNDTCAAVTTTVTTTAKPTTLTQSVEITANATSAATTSTTDTPTTYTTNTTTAVALTTTDTPTTYTTDTSTTVTSTTTTTTTFTAFADEYLIEFEIDAVDRTILKQIRNLLKTLSSPAMHSNINMSEMNITTVCSLNGTEYQCRCEDQYFWPCEKCTLYGSCDDITNVSCRCINTLPNSGHFCQPIIELNNSFTCPAVTPTADYLIEIEIAALDITLLNELRILSATFSSIVKQNNINITELNITTVCSLNGNKYQCRCEDQYFWPCEKCTLYGSCDHVNGSSCGCINDLPNDGHFCQQINELSNKALCPALRPTAEYLIEIEIDAVDRTVLMLLRNFSSTLSSPSKNTTINMTEMNITTVCSLNGTEYQCRCEDQYFWPCEKCSLYGSCNDVTNDSCGCIKGVPNDGHFCQPTHKLTDNDTCAAVTPTAKPTTLTQSVEITANATSAATTSTTDTPTTYTTNTTTAVASTTTDTPTTYTTNTTTAVALTTTDTPTTYTTNTSTTVTSTTTTTTTSTAFADIHVLNFSLALNEEFDFALTDQHSAKYQAYKTKIESSIDDSYRNIPSYQATSGKVTGFRPGSVIADFTIKTRSDNLNLVSVNQQLASNLRSEGFNVSETAFSQSVKDGLYENNGNIYPGTNLTLTCNAPFANDIIWTMNGNQLQTSNKYEINGSGLTVKHVTPNDNGQYACTTTVNSTPYVIWQTITIQPYPNIQVSSDKVVKCEDSVITLKCCVQGIYEVKWTDTVACKSTSTVPMKGCTLCEYKINNQECQSTDQVIQVTCQLTSPISGNTAPSYNSKNVRIEVSKRVFACSDSVFGAGNLGDVHFGDCNENMVGSQKAVCNTSGLWDTIENNCIIRIIKNLKEDAKNLQVTGIRDFMGNVINSTTEEAKSIMESPATILTIVDILTIISNLSQTILIDQPVMRDFLKTTDIIGSVGARDKWTHLNKNSTTMNASSELLKSIESIASRLGNGNFNITTNYTTLSKINVSAPFSETFGINLTTQINLPIIKKPIFITVIISSALENALPVRNLTNNDSTQTDTKINGDVTMIKTTSPINNISFYFAIKNKTLGNPQCVFWNFSLLNGSGGWDSTGCQLKPLGTKPERFTCECNHTTSFSILMSPFTPDNLALDYITYTGVTISMVSLVLCLIIEIIIWKSVTRNDTSFMRHLSIVNITVSLLIANICFISGADVVKQEGYEGPCSTATFFMHFFYLALFFWMFLSALLLLYRTLMVFSRMTRGAMMAIGFTVGYGAPLIIAVITVASTAGGTGYIQQENSCWLNWNKTKALLAFVIPALTIVTINFLVLIVVLFKMLRRGVNASVQPDEKHPLVVIARCVAILTPLFGLTWGFGIGTLVSQNFGIHVVFAFLNSLQGFFILLFGILLDSKVRHTLAGKLGLKILSSNHTGRMSAGPSSSSGRPFFQRV
ncbi:uncharacterized protein LOC113660902 [Tachysurus fulvidraco]|uniref:uncharacterized protein LOC113660902 n=1 Tax=Tachysurus fulvidraco TaxID=1234273 RepID=UPI001FEF0163|nr:uncharacterized protein LOC113660902 [Tachysurus fulvidraco]